MAVSCYRHSQRARAQASGKDNGTLQIQCSKNSVNQDNLLVTLINPGVLRNSSAGILDGLHCSQSQASRLIPILEEQMSHLAPYPPLQSISSLLQTFSGATTYVISFSGATTYPMHCAGTSCFAGVARNSSPSRK